MGAYFFILFAVIFLVFLNIIQIKKHSNIIIRLVCFFLFIVTGLRYITLLLFTFNFPVGILKFLAYFYYGSMIGLTIPSIVALWYTIPRFRKKINEKRLLLFLTPLFIFYFFMLYLQPLEIVIKTGIGYGLRLLFPWNLFVSIYYGFFVMIILLLCVSGFRWYKYKFPRSQYLLFFLSYLLLLVDGLTILFNRTNTFQPFIISEAFVLIALLYAFSTKPIKDKNKR
ncbi:MAG TPA: hypothetical protein PLC16_07525 [Defluviitaleaceae bacterium]|jgi:hypothetical protein|nr:hypothetical protein [Defluviitaleaceae bacterium]HPT76565.1 hypothetical protein [Defluviitaleaceae bacterium]